jgi:hypothetical protein
MSKVIFTFIAILAPTFILLNMFFTEKIPQGRKTLFLIILIGMVIVDVFAIYAYFGTSWFRDSSVSEPNHAITRSCQDMQKELLKGRGYSQEQLEEATLPICNCITGKLKERKEFDTIEEAAKEGKSFFLILKEYESLFLEAMNGCGK